MHYSKLAELEEIQMDIFLEALKCKREGNLRKFYSKVAIAKYLNSYLNGVFSGDNSPLKVYDDLFKKSVENLELDEENVDEFMRYGKHKAQRIIDLVEDPIEFLNKNIVSAKNFLKENSTHYNPLDFFSLN